MICAFLVAIKEKKKEIVVLERGIELDQVDMIG